MDARSFISTKHAAAVEELKAIEAEYLPRLQAARSAIELTQKWLDEMANMKPEAPKAVVVERAAPREVAFSDLSRLLIQKSEAEADEREAVASRAPSENWVSARDLQARTRQAS